MSRYSIIDGPDGILPPLDGRRCGIVAWWSGTAPKEEPMADAYRAVIPYESLDPLTIGASGDDEKLSR
jgi:hypothetical protein